VDFSLLDNIHVALMNVSRAVDYTMEPHPLYDSLISDRGESGWLGQVHLSTMLHDLVPPKKFYSAGLLSAAFDGLCQMALYFIVLVSPVSYTKTIFTVIR
jgi:hypothetical protein